MYNPKSKTATEFISDSENLSTIEYARGNCGDRALVESVLEKARAFKGLTHREEPCCLSATTAI